VEEEIRNILLNGSVLEHLRNLNGKVKGRDEECLVYSSLAEHL